MMDRSDAEKSIRFGKWIWRKDGILKCSECHAELKEDITDYLDGMTPFYCPMCGSMNGSHGRCSIDRNCEHRYESLSSDCLDCEKGGLQLIEYDEPGEGFGV